MPDRIKSFQRGEVLRHGRLNELVDSINEEIARPSGTTTEDGTTRTVWTEVSRDGNAVEFVDAFLNRMVLAFATTTTSWSITEGVTAEETVSGDSCDVEVTRVTGYEAVDDNGNVLTITGFDTI